MRNTIRNASMAIALLATVFATTNLVLANSYTTDEVLIKHSSSEQNTQRPARQNPMQQMLENLNLSDEQSTQINAILEASRPDQNSQQRPSREAHDAMMDQIKALLTDTQIAQIEESQKNMGGKPQGKTQR